MVARSLTVSFALRPTLAALHLANTDFAEYSTADKPRCIDPRMAAMWCRIRRSGFPLCRRLPPLARLFPPAAVLPPADLRHGLHLLFGLAADAAFRPEFAEMRLPSHQKRENRLGAAKSCTSTGGCILVQECSLLPHSIGA